MSETISSALGRLVGHSPAVQGVRDTLGRMARFRGGAVVILGETGTGKGVAAEALHALRGRSRPYEHLNCGDLGDAAAIA